MANSTYCIILRGFEASTTIRFGTMCGTKSRWHTIIALHDRYGIAVQAAIGQIPHSRDTVFALFLGMMEGREIEIIKGTGPVGRALVLFLLCITPVAFAGRVGANG